MGRSKEDIIKRLKERTQQNGRGCWEYTMYRTKKGYGIMWAFGSRWRAHRLSYYLFYGAIPVNTQIQHICDNPSCVNPDHLKPGTPKENTKDMLSRSRDKGNRNLSFSQIETIRIMSRLNIFGSKTLSKCFNISERYCRKIINKKCRLKR